MNNNSCKFDKNCPEAEVCYNGVTWKMGALNSDVGVNGGMVGCDCSTYYGFKRSSVDGKCSEWDVTAFFVVICYSVLAAIAFVFFLVGARDIKKLYDLGKLTGVLATTCLFNALALLFLGLAAVGTILNSATPIYSPIQYSDVYNDETDKVAANILLERIAITFCNVFGLLAVLNITPLIILGVTITGLLIAFGIFLGFGIAGFIVIPFTLLFIAAYLKSLFTMRKLFSGTDEMRGSGNKASKAVISEFVQATYIILTGLVIVLVTSVAYSLMELFIGWKELCKPGEVPYLIVNVFLGRAGFFIILFGIFRYIHHRVVKMVNQDKSRGASSHNNVSSHGHDPAIKATAESNGRSVIQSTAATEPPGRNSGGGIQMENIYLEPEGKDTDKAPKVREMGLSVVGIQMDDIHLEPTVSKDGVRETRLSVGIQMDDIHLEPTGPTLQAQTSIKLDD